MRLDSNLSRPRNDPNGKSVREEEEAAARNSRYNYDRWAAARKHAHRHADGAGAGVQAAAAVTTGTSSPQRASALCYANSLDFVNLFCSDAVDSDEEDEMGVNSKANDDMLTLTRSLAFGGSIDTDDDDNHHEGRMISLASKSEVSELQERLEANLRLSDDLTGRGSAESSFLSNVTPCTSNKKAGPTRHVGQAAGTSTPNTCDITPPRSNSSSLASTPVSNQDWPRKRLEYGGSTSNATTIPNSKNINAVGKHMVTTTDTYTIVSHQDAYASANSGAGKISTRTNDKEPEESGTELVLIHMSKSAAIL